MYPNTRHDRRPYNARRTRNGHCRLGRVSRAGAAAVEFAMVAPIIFLFFFTSVETGRLLMAVHGLDAAAREGCRHAVTLDVSTREVKESVEERLETFKISDHSLTIEPDPPNIAAQWELITVRIVVPFNEVSWLPLPGFLDRVTLSGSCTMPQESRTSSKT